MINGVRADTILASVKVDGKATPELTWYGSAGYADLEAYSHMYLSGESTGSREGSFVSVDGGIKYMLAKNISYRLDVGAVIPDDITAQDDTAYVGVQRIDFKF